MKTYIFLKQFIAVLCFLITSYAIAYDDMNETPEEVAKAIEEVQKAMASPDFSKKAAAESKEAAQVANYVSEISGNPELEREIYKLAAEVLGNMKGQNINQMQQILNEAKNNPEAFANKWTPEQRRKLQELSQKLPAARGTNP